MTPEISTEVLKERKRRKQHKRSQFKRTSPAWMRITLRIGKINRTLRKRKRVQTAEDVKVVRVFREAQRCVRAGLHYVWGGGHSHSPAPGPLALKQADSGYDCSSYWSHLLQTIIQDFPTCSTFSLVDHLEPGVGEHITLYIKNEPASDAHVIGKLIMPNGKVIWTQCGGRDNTKVGDGPCFFTPTSSRVHEFHPYHPKGL